MNTKNLLLALVLVACADPQTDTAKLNILEERHSSNDVAPTLTLPKCEDADAVAWEYWHIVNEKTMSPWQLEVYGPPTAHGCHWRHSARQLGLELGLEPVRDNHSNIMSFPMYWQGVQATEEQINSVFGGI